VWKNPQFGFTVAEFCNYEIDEITRKSMPARYQNAGMLIAVCTSRQEA
jgi:hypothetical protein